MITLTLEEQEVRDLVKALSAYRSQWTEKATSIERRIRLIDAHTCRGRKAKEEMTVDLKIAESYTSDLDALGARLLKTIR